MKCPSLWQKNYNFDHHKKTTETSNSCDSCAANFKSQKWKKTAKYANSKNFNAVKTVEKPVFLHFQLFKSAECSIRTARVLVFCIAVLCYANSFDGQFVFDDAEAVVRNNDAKWLGGSSFWELFTNDYWGYKIRSNTSHKSYRPLTVFTFRLNHWWSSTDSRSYHAVNIMLHAVVSVLCYELFRCASVAFGKSEKASFFSGIFFACHPVHTECVANIAGRAELLAALWFLLTFFAYKKSIESSSSVRWFCVAIGTTFLSLLSKEQGITVLGICATYDLLKTFDSDTIKSIRDLWNKAISDWSNNNDFDCNELLVLRRRLCPMVMRLFLITSSGFVMIVFRLWVVNFEAPQFTSSDNPASFHPSLLFRVLNYNYLYVLNLWLLVNPSELCFDYSMGCIPLIDSVWDLRLLAVLALWIGTLLVLYKIVLLHQMDRRYAIFGLACLIVPFLPASNLIVRVGFVLAERVLYLPSIGYCILIGGVLETAETMIGRTKNVARVSRRHLEIAGCFIVFLFCAKSMQRSNEWRSENSLFKSGVKVCPNNAKVHYNLGKILSDVGNLQDAEQKYREALKLNPDYEQAMNNLANMLKDQSKFREAEQLLISAIRIRPDFSAAWMNLGIVQAALKKYGEAEQSYSTALSHRKHYPDCHFNLGNLYLEQNRGYEALASWTNATQQKPTHAKAWINQLVFLDSQDDCSRAISLGLTALRFVPNEPALHFSVGSCLGKLERMEEAEKHFLMAVNLDPENANYYANLGVLYHRASRVEHAESMYRKALHLDASLTHAAKNLKVLLRKIREQTRKI